MKWLIRIFFVIIVSYGLQYTPVVFNDNFCLVIYTVIGILFSLALNQIMTFAFTDIPNDKFVENQRSRIAKIRKIYIILFAFATLVLLLKSLTLELKWKWIKFNFNYLFGSYLIFSLGYFIENFISLAKLKDQIDDEIRKLKNSKKNE